MNTLTVLSIMFGILGFIVANLITYKSFGSLDFWDVILLGGLGAIAGALIGILVMMVGVSIAF